MAESGSSAQEKTEAPTAKKLRDARRQGDVWQSRDVTTTATVLLFTLAAVLGAKPALAWLVRSLNDTVLAATQQDTDVLGRDRGRGRRLGQRAGKRRAGGRVLEL
jgi:type III secretion protein U